MTTDRSHEEIKDLVAAYVLGAVPEDEAFLARTHILSCDECLAEAESYTGLVARLGLTAEDAPLSPGFADRVLAAAVHSPDHRTVTDAPDTRKPRFRVGLVAAVLSALAVVGGLTAGLVLSKARLDRNEKILTALLHADGNTVELRGRQGAVAKLIPSFSGSYFVSSGLEKAPRNHVYQLWLVREGTPVSAGIFDGSDAITILSTDADLERYDAAAITIEPEGGSAEPTTEPILSADASG